MDSKSIGLCPQGFESPRCRFWACFHFRLGCALAFGYSLLSLPRATWRQREPVGRPWLHDHRHKMCTSAQHADDTVPERLRGWTRNPLGSARRGSNPLGVVSFVRASAWIQLGLQPCRPDCGMNALPRIPQTREASASCEKRLICAASRH